MNNQIDIENVIADEIRNRMQKHMSRKDPEGSIEKIKNSIIEYLTEINNTMGFSNLPVVIVENEGPFITINFFDDSENRLETLGDMIEFMGRRQGD